MPKLSDINIDTSKFRGKGIRPWNDPNVVKPLREKTGSNTLANREQTVSKALANREQTVSKPLANREQTVSKPLAEPLAEPLANREQSVSKPLANAQKTRGTEAIEILVGNEKTLLTFLFQKCQAIGSLESMAITTQELKNLLKINAEHLRNLIYRIVKKGIIEINTLKKGRAGWRKFRFTKETFQYLSLEQSVSKPLANREQSVSKPLAEPLAEPLATLSSSSSIYNITTTTNELPEEWKNIDISPLEKINFSEYHLLQLYKKAILTLPMVQNSIYAFSYDLRNNDKIKEIKKSPLEFFLGILLKKNAPYAPPDNYESPKDEALRLYLEKQRVIEKTRAEREKEALNLAFNDWYNQISDEELLKLMPDLQIKQFGKKSALIINVSKAHFTETIWSKKHEEIIKKYKQERIEAKE